MRIVALDITRFIAALSVVLYHYISRPESNAYPLLSEFTNYGYLGVPLFFIISGYVIALSANHRTPIQFGVSRFVRLYPALWAGVVFTVISAAILTDKQYELPQILANFTLLNEYLGFEDIERIYWTLKAELKFYACVFLLLLFGIFRKFRSWLSIWLGLTVLHTISGQPYFMGWFISPAYSSFFIAGIACFLIQTEGRNYFNLFILLSSLVVSSFNAFEQTTGFLVEPSFIDKSISVVIIWGFYAFFYLLCTEKINLADRKIYTILGALTYPLYLIHNIAGKAIIDTYSDTIPEEIMIFIVIFFMIFVSLLINMGIEKQLASPMKKFLLSKLSNK